MACSLDPKMVVLFVVGVIFVYLLLSGTFLGYMAYESYYNYGGYSSQFAGVDYNFSSEPGFLSEPMESFENPSGFSGELTSSLAPIDQTLSAGGMAVVAMHADFCGHCKNMIPEWNKFYKKCNGKKINGKQVSVCAAEHQNMSAVSKLKKTYGVEAEGFPTIVKLRKAADGGVIKDEYSGDRTADALESWCKN